MAGALDGIKVLEVSQIVAGPYCGLNLADLGADVVKIEPFAGEGSRASGSFFPGESKGFHSLNRGKRSLVLDLQKQEARALVHRLIAGFDVFLINARAGVPQKLQVDYDTLTRFRPDLIYFENTGFGRRGPLAQRAGSDAVAQAYSGLAAGDSKVDQYGAPDIVSATAPADYQAGLAGAMGICAALFHRERTGRGQYVETSLLQAALAVQGTRVSRLPVIDAVTTDVALARMREVQAAGGSYREQIEARGSLFDTMGRAAARLWYGGYAVKDGGVILGALTPLNRDQMRRAVGIDDDPSADPEFNSMDPESRKLVDATLARMRAMRVGVLNICAPSLHATRLVSSLRVTANMRSASCAPARASTVGCAALPTMVRKSSRSWSCFRRTGSVSTTVMSLASEHRLSATDAPT